jgi:hypothetical protein
VRISGATGTTPHQVAPAGSLREITDTEMVRGGSTICACWLTDRPAGLLVGTGGNGGLGTMPRDPGTGGLLLGLNGINGLQ